MVMLQIPTLVGEGYFGIYSTHCWNVAANSDLMLGDQTLLGDDPYPAAAYWDGHVHLLGMSTHFKCSLCLKNQSLTSLKIHLKLPYLLQKTLHDEFSLIINWERLCSFLMRLIWICWFKMCFCPCYLMTVVVSLHGRPKYPRFWYSWHYHYPSIVNRANLDNQLDIVEMAGSDCWG